VVAQIRTVATDLLRSLGCHDEEASMVVRRRFERQRDDAQRSAAERGPA
jgi:hypothetical protein